MELKIRYSARYHNVFLTRWSFARVKTEIGLLVTISSKIYIFGLIWQMFPQGIRYSFLMYKFQRKAYICDLFENLLKIIPTECQRDDRINYEYNFFFYEFIQKMPEI